MDTQAGFSCDYVIAEGFYKPKVDGIHDAWREALDDLVKRRRDTLVYVDDASLVDMAAVEEVLAGQPHAKLIDAWTHVDKRVQWRKVRSIMLGMNM